MAAGKGGRGERANRAEGRAMGKEVVRKQEQCADFGLGKIVKYLVRAIVRRI